MLVMAAKKEGESVSTFVLKAALTRAARLGGKTLKQFMPEDEYSALVGRNFNDAEWLRKRRRNRRLA